MTDDKEWHAMRAMYETKSDDPRLHNAFREILSLRAEVQRWREMYADMDKDYRSNSEKLADMCRPEAREGREKLLLQQLGEQQSQLFDTQHKLRMANVALELGFGRPINSEATQKQLALAEQAIVAGHMAFADAAKTVGCVEYQYTSKAAALALPSGEKDSDYYERLLADLMPGDDDRPLTSGEMRRMTDSLSGVNKVSRGDHD